MDATVSTAGKAKEEEVVIPPDVKAKTPEKPQIDTEIISSMIKIEVQDIMNKHTKREKEKDKGKETPSKSETPGTTP